MRQFLQRSIWLSVWAATMYLAVWVSWQMATDQPILFYIIVLALVVMSLGFYYSTQHWSDDNRGRAAASLWVGLVALLVVVVAEVSYWSSDIEGVHHQIVREKAKQSGADLVQERRRLQLSRATAGKLPGQIRAEIATAVNQTEARALRAQLAAAEELERLQGQVIADSTEVVNFSIRRSFYETARLGSENIGGSLKAWIFGITMLVVVFVLSLHSLSLVIGISPQRRHRGSVAAERSSGIIVPPMSTSAVLSHPEAFAPPSEPETVPVSPPEPKISPKKEAETVTQKYPVLVTEDQRFAPKSKPRSKAERNEAVDVITKRWMEAGRVAQVPLARGDTGKALYGNYAEWCGAVRIAPVNDSHFGRSIRRLKVGAGKGAHGATYALKIVERKAEVA